ncbi:metal ABC transporter ATP-binding protein [Companilactobacillus sp. FL22-1]|uniref:metal ABC transporter ATP-binding protein n=1 Tax=Companilactobacillus sp. FL22-1 TaxID=3373892 RepID=UPI0037551571
MIEVNNLTKKFGQQLVFKKINFTIKQGEFVSLIGTNGSGKTTLIKILLGIESQTTGLITINQRKIGYVPQFRNIDNDYPLSIKQFIDLNLKFTLNLKKRRQNKALLQKVITKTQLSQIQDRPLGLISGGEKQKAYLAQALLTQPDVLILDEATASLDVAVKRQLMDLVRELNQKEQLTVILITHDYELTKEYTDRVLLFQDKTLKEIALTDVSENMFAQEEKNVCL